MCSFFLDQDPVRFLSLKSMRLGRLCLPTEATITTMVSLA